MIPMGVYAPRAGVRFSTPHALLWTLGCADPPKEARVTNVLNDQAESIVDVAMLALQRSHEPHYAEAGNQVSRERLTALLALVADCVATRNLVPMIERATALADERFDGGFDISEVQVAFHVLEEAIWSRVVSVTPQDELVEAIGLIGTVVGAGRDALARQYVARASRQHVTSLDLSALFRGGA